MDLDGLTATLEAGAAAVVAKSWNGSPEAAAQLEAAEYVLLDEDWRPLPWGPAPRSASLFCRSGLPGIPFGRWVDMIVAADHRAAVRDAYVVASLIVADPDETADRAGDVQAAGLRWLELNVGAPHAEEASPGAIRATDVPDEVAGLVRRVRDAVTIPLTVKLGGQGNPLPAVEAAREAGADAVCLAGRHLAFLPDVETRRAVLGTFGAIGGAWALPLTLRWIAKARQRFGPGLPLIGTNGSRDSRDVVRFLLAGASAVQMTTVVMTDGPEALTRAIEGLERYLSEQGTSVASIIGEAADHVTSYQEAGG
jgi:dihydroorotate dehydrogenase (NAD+) catalytic subunit